MVNPSDLQTQSIKDWIVAGVWHIDFRLLDLLINFIITFLPLFNARIMLSSPNTK